MDVIRRGGEAGAIAADDRLQRLVEAAVVGVERREPVARSLGAFAQPHQIDGQHAAVLDDHAAADHDAVTAVPSSAWTSWLTGLFSGSQFG